jgi:hypothetical protein
MNLVELKEYKDHVPIVAQSLAIFGLLVVGCGFLSLTVYHASLGIPQTSFLRPKIVSTGLLLLVFAAAGVIPAIVYARQKPQAVDSLKVNFINNLSAVEGYVIGVVVASGMYIRPLLGGWGEHLNSRLIWFTLVVFVPVFLDAIPASAWPLWKHMVRFVVVTACISFGLIRLHDALIAILIVWLIFCGYCVSLTRLYLRKPERFSYLYVVVTLLGIVGIFGRNIYPYIPPAACGGEPVPATVTFGDKQPPLGSAPQMKVWFVDETDAGYYFLQTKDAKKAIYIPRAGVSLIVYGD